MFEVKCLVSDKKLAEVLNSLGGLTLQPPVVEPVALTNGASKPPGMTAEAALMDYLREKKPKQLSTKEMKAHLLTKGYSNNGYSYALKVMLGKKILKKTKVPALYEVIHG